MKIARLIRLLVVFSGSLSVTQGQSILPMPLSTIDTEHARPWVVKFAPLSLFDPDNTVQFGIERLLGQRQSVQLELGYGGQGMNLWRSTQNSRYTDREIWRGRAEWRYYFTKTGQPLGRYIAIEGFYKQVNVIESGTIGVGCTTGPCQYYQLFTAPLTKYVWGGHVKIGRQFPIIPHNDRLLADFYVGIGFRRRIIEQISQPTGAYYYRSSGFGSFDSFNPIEYPTISMAYGMKIGYAF